MRTKNRTLRIDFVANLLMHPVQDIEKINKEVGSLLPANGFPITVQSSALRKTTLFARF